MNQQDIYKMLEDKIISQLESGIIPWRRCYHVNYGDMCTSHQTKKPYSFLNQFILEKPGEYWTFEQARKEGYSIKKGSKASKIVFWKILNIVDSSSSENEDDISFKNIPFLRFYNVFHESDVDGLPEKVIADETEEQKSRNIERNEMAEKIIDEYLSANSDIKLIFSDRIPCFCPSTNTIYMPKKSQFDSLADYYSTIFHEMVHSTKGKLNRVTNHSTQDRAKEELVAEIGSAYLCGKSDINDDEIIKNSASYCANWIRPLRGNIKMLISASSQAEKAVRLILNEPKDEESKNSEV